MKERIVLEKHEFYNLLYFLPTQMVKTVKKERKAIFMGKEIKPEKLPETWEELKELCRELNKKTNKIYLIEKDFIELQGDDMYGFTIDKKGTISSNLFDQVFKQKQTVSQMWNFIKIIVGE